MFDKLATDFFPRSKLASLQMAPPLITESVFLPFLVRLPAPVPLSFFPRFYSTLSRFYFEPRGGSAKLLSVHPHTPKVLLI